MEYKSSTIFKVNGGIINEGTYTSNDGTKVTFTPELIKKIFSKVNDHVPYYLTHDGAEEERIPSGYAYKVGIDDNGTTITHQGFVFDRKTMESISIAGYDSGSAEIDFVFNDAGDAVDGTLTGIAFVPNPAILGTNVSAAATVFSRQKDKNSSSEDNMTKDIAEVEKQLNETRARELEFSQKLDDEKKAHEATKLQFATVQEEIVNLKKKYTDLLSLQVTSLTTEVKGLGFSAPEKIIEGLDVDNQVAVLTRIKGQFSAPGMVPPKVEITSGSAPAGSSEPTADDVKKARFAAMKELGLTEDDFAERKTMGDE